MEVTKKMEEALQQMGEVLGIGRDWYEIGETEIDEDGNEARGIYAKNDADGEKVMAFLEIAAENIKEQEHDT